MNTQPEDIRKEGLLIKKWKFSSKSAKEFAGGIMVTGANSFIGCHVVSELKVQYPGKIHLLLRAPTKQAAIDKMSQALLQWGLKGLDMDQVEIHLGDVGEPQMNLSTAEFKRVKKEVGQVIHLAMTPMYHLPYHHFQRIWIPELERMIRFCGDPEHPKFLHYASSFNANFFQSEDDFMAVNTNAWQSGYAGFKWVAGKAIQNAMGQGLDACIYDIPLVLGTEKSGICPAHYSIWLILDIFLKTGLFFPFRFKIIPVDILADLIVFNALLVKNERSCEFTRPFLAKPADDQLFERTAANLLGLHRAGLEEVRAVCQNKLRFEFMMPSNFNELLEKVNGLPAIFPEGYEHKDLPMTPLVFMSNLNRIMSAKKVKLQP